MNRIPLRHVRPFLNWRRRGSLARVLAALLALMLLIPTAAQTAHADSGTICEVNGQFTTNCPPNTNFPPPALLNLHQPTYAATAAQAASLQVLEQQAITNTIADHGLPSTDANAVASWGRDDAEAELWALLVQSINTTPRTADQKNAVDWLTGLMKYQAVQAAGDAGLEYVKWAGLDQTQYKNLLATNPSQSDLQNFLSSSVVNFNGNNTGGYCLYRSPSPYGTEYTGSNDQTCFTPCTSLLGCDPPTPTYDQFVKWGGADVNNALFNSAQFALVSRSIAMGVGFGAAVVGAVTGIALSAALATALVGSALQVAIFPFLAIPLSTAVVPGALSGAAAAELAGGVTAAAVGFIVAVVIAAIAIAAMEGINVVSAAALPGQLATLIADAPTNTPDLGAALKDSTKAQGLFSLFVGATLPAPLLATCDNSGPLVIGAGTIYPTPCLNPTAIPAAANTDPVFAIQAKGASTTTYATTLTWKDAATQFTTTARLSGNWFVDQETDSAGNTATLQTLRIAYTDWNGNEQTAWLVHTTEGGYRFLGFPKPSSGGTPLDPSTCLTAGTCFYSAGIDYVGADGNDYSASVTPALAPTVTTTVSANPTEGSPIAFTANGTSPLGLTPITYQWQFEGLACTYFPGGIQLCTIPDGGPFPYADGGSASGAQVNHTFTTSGTYHVAVTATDPAGRSTMDLFTVTVADATPLLTSLTHPSTVDLGSVSSLTGTIQHYGSDDTEIVDINWGDGTTDDRNSIGPGAPGPTDDPQLTLTAASAGDCACYDADFSATHTYAQPGSYTVKATVTDQSGAAAIAPSGATTTALVMGTQTIAFAAIPDHTYGDAPFPISATGGASGQPVTFTTADPTVCTVSQPTGGVDAGGNGTGGATVTIVASGACSISANQAGTSSYHAADPVPQSFSVGQASLTITAGNKTTPYGQLPSLTWTGAGWVPGESAATLATSPNSPPTCGATVNGSAETETTVPGIYPGAITCTGAVDPNYAIGYVSGTLTVDPLLSLDEQGLPTGVPHQAVLDGSTAGLPDGGVELAYGSTHSYRFPATVTNAAGTVYITNDPGFSGPFTANQSNTAVYSTISQVVATALAGGGVNSSGVAAALTQQFNAVQADIAAHNMPQALTDMHSFAGLVRAQSGKHIATATANLLLTDAQLVYTSLGGSGSV